MKNWSCILLATVAGLLAGCSSTPEKVDRGPISAKTFSFVSRANRPAPGYTDDRQAVHAMIQEAITKNLSNRGLSKVESGGDVTVAYLVIIGNNASTAAISEYFGYGPDAAALAEKAHKAYTKSKTPNYFEAGTLVIDLIDSKSYKLLSRHEATRPILRELPANGRAERIEEVVDDILRDVRIASP